ncbi:MAG: hypothetical protein HUU28_02420 [Planctomycetaceae bacterium]|nr:hypothetical protein [Planctomycetaceae bacterium]
MKRVVGGVALLALALAAQGQNCHLVGGAGTFPLSGSDDGLWPGVLPSGPLVMSQTVSAPAGATVARVRLLGLQHSWSTDVMVVLRDPAGTRHLLFQRDNGSNCGGCGDDFFGTYTISAASTLAWSACGLGILPQADYAQEFGSWPSGSAGVLNTPMAQIPVTSGTWSLELYDWCELADDGALSAWELCFDVPPPPPNEQCAPYQQAGEFIPGFGATQGTFPTVLPGGVASSSLQYWPSPGAELSGVRLFGLQHDRRDDVMIVLEDPAGAQHLIFQRDDGAGCSGCADDFFGDYTFTSRLAPTLPPCGSANPLVSGTYAQEFGSWPPGLHGIDTTPLALIPALPGLWTLHVYDWCSSSGSGSFDGWQLCANLPPPPTNYCTAGVSTAGCSAALTSGANPSVSGQTTPYLLASMIEGQRSGLIFYSITGRSQAPWNTSSFLCVKAPTQRTGALNSGGNAGQCDGEFLLDWNDFQNTHPNALGRPWSAGDKVFVQAWFRDPPAGKSTTLSNALELTYLP